MQWSERIGRRIKLRDLHVLLAVAQAGSMSRAADRLAISHPVISKTVSELEHVLGLRLLDRTPQGVELTPQGHALVECGAAVFDELRRGVQAMETLSDPASGEIRLGTTRPLMDGLVPAVIERLAARYPRVAVHVEDADGPVLCDMLRARKFDFLVSRTAGTFGGEDFATEFLFQEPMFVVAGLGGKWSSRRRMSFAELSDERWVLPAADNFLGAAMIEGFAAAGLPLPRSAAVANSVAARLRLAETGRFLTMLPGSMLHFGRGRMKVKILPVTLPIRSEPVEIMRLKHRTISPVVQLFIDELHKIVRPLRKSAL